MRMQGILQAHSYLYLYSILFDWFRSSTYIYIHIDTHVYAWYVYSLTVAFFICPLLSLVFSRKQICCFYLYVMNSPVRSCSASWSNSIIISIIHTYIDNIIYSGMLSSTMPIPLSSSPRRWRRQWWLQLSIWSIVLSPPYTSKTYFIFYVCLKAFKIYTQAHTFS